MANKLVMANVPRRVELAYTLNKDILKDMPDACTTRQLGCGQLLTAAVKHLTIAHSVCVQQPEEQCPAAQHTNRF